MYNISFLFFCENHALVVVNEIWIWDRLKTIMIKSSTCVDCFPLVSVISLWNRLIESSLQCHWSLRMRLKISATGVPQNMISRIENNILKIGNVFQIIKNIKVYCLARYWYVQIFFLHGVLNWVWKKLTMFFTYMCIKLFIITSKLLSYV